EDGDHNIWMGTWANGVTVFNPDKNTFRRFKNDPKNPSSIAGDNIWSIFRDHNNVMWVGTLEKGLCSYNAKTGQFSSYTVEKNNLSSNNVMAITEDVFGNLWVGTDGAGIDILDKTSSRFTQYQHNDDLNSISDNGVNGLYADKT